ncbi:response regulator transcription factor [Methylorubrum extorquens]|uniref:response regulator transcription factor n=1 Tax=Methylorubrum extorquens TaxID=408 RepID=UPI000158F529|nr:response regulator transcription factor [Methylorubrum extorquens]ABY31957.1 regulatory protein LuxR [Methylorubrum extorquens PA1]WIU38565.1 response regulator transcription factor [Methylorubrum extorquens]
MPRIIIADDDTFFRTNLRRILEERLKGSSVSGVSNSSGLIKRLLYPPRTDLAIVGSCLLPADDPTYLGALKRAAGAARLMLVVSQASADLFQDALSLGFHGLVVRRQSQEEVLVAVRTILEGRLYAPSAILSGSSSDSTLPVRRPELGERPFGLTVRQLEVLSLIGKGLSNREIADVLRIAEATVKIHVSAVFRALGVRNRTEAALILPTMTR